MICIYAIKFPDGKHYVGSTTDFKTRMSKHKSLFKKKSDQHYMYTLYNDEFEMLELIVLEECKKDALIERERFYVDSFDSIRQGYNVSVPGMENVGRIKTRKEIEKKLKSQRDNMPFFKVENKHNKGLYMITNSYDRAGSYVGLSPHTVRRKLRNNLKCSKYNYTYL